MDDADRNSVMTLARVLTAVIILPLIAAIAPQSPSVRPIEVRLLPVNGSGLSGMATLKPQGTGLIVSIVLYGSTARGRVRFAHFHHGTCEHVSSPAVYALEPVRNGRSTTMLFDVGLEELLHGTYSVLIHASSSRTSPHVACGTIAGV